MYNIEGDNKIQLELRVRADGKIDAHIRVKVDEQGNYLSCAKVFNIPQADYDELLIFIYVLFCNEKVSTAAENILEGLITKRAKTYKQHELEI